jgi:hypothetical protein
MLRLAVTRTGHGLAVELLKGRGLAPRTIELKLS